MRPPPPPPPPAPLHRCTAAPQVHHTDIGDESCFALGSLLLAASNLNELHVSDSEVALRGWSCTAPTRRWPGDEAQPKPIQVTLRGLRALGKAAAAAGCGDGGRKRLYVNARHLGGEEALAIAHEFQAVAIFRLQVSK